MRAEVYSHVARGVVERIWTVDIVVDGMNADAIQWYTAHVLLLMQK